MNRSVVSIAVSGGVFLGIAACIHCEIPPRRLSASCTALFAYKTIRNHAGRFLRDTHGSLRRSERALRTNRACATCRLPLVGVCTFPNTPSLHLP